MEPQDLDSITHDLAYVQRQLLDLPDDAFADRYRLQKRQDQLREDAARFRQDRDKSRGDADLLAELAAYRSRLAAIEKQKIDVVTQMGGGGYGSPAGADGYGAAGLNIDIAKAHGAGEVHARIGRLKNILEERGVEIPPK